MRAKVKPMAPPARSAAAVAFKLPPTRSGDALLLPMHDSDAVTLTPGEFVLTPWTTGYLVLRVERVRDDVRGDWNPKDPKNQRAIADPREACHVIETTAISINRRLAFAPCDVLRVQEIGGDVA